MNPVSSMLIGCVADDFTGASDAASFIDLHGIPTLLIAGVPDGEIELPEDVQAVVIALKSRSSPAREAVAESLRAFDWLRNKHPRYLYFKYCSTFDSTASGNIGPVTDAVLERYDLPYTILCPSLLVNGRTVKDCVLYVDGVPLAESHMKHHPLNPMWDSDLTKLMKPQGKYPCHKITFRELSAGKEAIDNLLTKWRRESKHFYVAVDFFTQEQGPQIVECFGDLPFLTGGSGVCGEIARSAASGTAPARHPVPRRKPRLLLAGSCSAMTKKQVNAFLQTDHPSLELRPSLLLSGELAREDLIAFYEKNRGRDILYYTSGSAGLTDNIADADQERVSRQLEADTAFLARYAVTRGCTRLIVAGGETSGAVMQAIGGSAYRVVGSAAPGVPVLSPVDNPDLRLVLKSGNFGGESFLLETLAEEGDAQCNRI